VCVGERRKEGGRELSAQECVFEIEVEEGEGG